jgi:hypothetical protein
MLVPPIQETSMRTHRLVARAVAAASVAAVLLLPSPAASQWQQAPRAIRYGEMDRDRDGVITRSEWQGTRQAFEAADWNRDGVLSGDEVRLDARDVRPDNDAGARRTEFLRLDRNNDGLLSSSEWKGPRGEFSDYDVNRDGVLTQREYVGRSDRAPRPIPADARTVDVDARVRWVYVGFVVDKGDILTFNTEGSVQLSEDANDTAIAAGAPTGRRAPDAPMPEELAGALIARIGNGAAFGVGDQRQIIAPASGQLFLGVNDDHLADNRGRFRVRVSTRMP